MGYALSGLRYDGEAVNGAVLSVSELVANAVEYVAGPYELRLRRTASDVICEVVDQDPRIPEIPCLWRGAQGGGVKPLDVKVWGVRKRNTKEPLYDVRWIVTGKVFSEQFRIKGPADHYRS